jgi:hypothetical protein
LSWLRLGAIVFVTAALRGDLDDLTDATVIAIALADALAGLLLTYSLLRCACLRCACLRCACLRCARLRLPALRLSVTPPLRTVRPKGGVREPSFRSPVSP